MSVENHIHIIASGENIHNTVPYAINEFKMSKAVVVVEKSLFQMPDYKRNPKIIESIHKVEDMAKMTKKAFEVKHMDGINLNSIRDTVMEIVEENGSDSTYYFNVSGGTKVLSNGLFMMALWLDGIVYHVGEDQVLQKLIIPRLHVEDVKKNPNYMSILKNIESSKGHMKMRKHLYNELKTSYTQIRDNHGRARRGLSPGTLSKWTADLVKMGLIREKPTDNRKEKLYEITDDGIFTLKFFQLRKLE